MKEGTGWNGIGSILSSCCLLPSSITKLCNDCHLQSIILECVVVIWLCPSPYVTILTYFMSSLDLSYITPHQFLDKGLNYLSPLTILNNISPVIIIYNVFIQYCRKKATAHFVLFTFSVIIIKRRTNSIKLDQIYST